MCYLGGHAVVGVEWNMEMSAKYLHHLNGTTGLSSIKGAENKTLGKNSTGLQEETGNGGWYG